MDDLTNFFKSGSVSNLDWLDVDEEEYRRLDTLPKQNLDIAPDLQAIWRHEDQPASHYVPNTGAPRTMGDLAPSGRMRSTPEDLVRTARLALVQSADVEQFQKTLTARYDLSFLRENRAVLASVLAERGLLGNVYIAAQDFPNCHKGVKSQSDFVRKFAGTAPFVQEKTACGDCIHRKSSPQGVHCAVFHKQIVVDVPYTDEMARTIEATRNVTASTLDAKSRVQAAYLHKASASAGFSGHRQFTAAPVAPAVTTEQGLIALSNLTKKRDAAQQQRLAAEKARPVIALLRREMLKGRTRTELVHAMRLAFDPRDLQATRTEWEPVFNEVGLFGAVYSTQEAFKDCREGADFLSRHTSTTRAIVAGEKCGSCIYNKVSRCLMYGKPLVASVEAALTPDMVDTVLTEHFMAGRLASRTASEWGATPVQQLKGIHEAAKATSMLPASGSVRAAIQHGYYGQTKKEARSEMVRRDVVKTASEYLNEGLYGQDLLTALRKRFTDSDLKMASTELRGLVSEQGLQGIYYIDPTIYSDYGHGCKEASRKHRSRGGVRYAKVGDKCDSCVHQTRLGYCSVLDKNLVVEPPYIDKKAEQAAMLATGRATEIRYEDLMNNGLSMMDEYQLQHREAAVAVDDSNHIDVDIQFGSQKVKL